MPLIKLQMSENCAPEMKEELCCCLSKICADRIGKPESYVASVVEDGAIIAFGGQVEKAAYVEVKSIGGLGGGVNRELSAAICDCLEAKAGIPGNRVYINFTDVPASSWGTNGSTFG